MAEQQTEESYENETSLVELGFERSSKVRRKDALDAR